MPTGMFTRLAAGDLPETGKRWPSDNGNGRVFIITSCTGKFSTTAVPLTQVGAIAPNYQEIGSSSAHGELKARNQAQALKTLKLYVKN